VIEEKSECETGHLNFPGACRITRFDEHLVNDVSRLGNALLKTIQMLLPIH
jgi:hypothetical protein